MGAFLHLLDLFDLRLKFSEMPPVWQYWTLYLVLADALAAVGLITGKSFGVVVLLVVALSQLVAYTVWASVFGQQTVLIVFHVLTLIGLALFRPSRAAVFEQHQK